MAGFAFGRYELSGSLCIAMLCPNSLSKDSMRSGGLDRGHRGHGQIHNLNGHGDGGGGHGRRGSRGAQILESNGHGASGGRDGGRRGQVHNRACSFNW